MWPNGKADVMGHDQQPSIWRWLWGALSGNCDMVVLPLPDSTARALQDVHQHLDASAEELIRLRLALQSRQQAADWHELDEWAR